MKITVVGTGYVGLVSGTCFSEVGINVTCVDNDKNKVESLNNDIVTIYEPGLDGLVKRNREKGRLRFTTDLPSALIGSEVLFIAVGTPPGEDGSADLRHVLNVAHEIGRNIKDYLLIATKSTVPVGTSLKVRKAVQEELDKRGIHVEFDVASNPEFLKEGAAVNDFLKPDRIIVGTDSEMAMKVMQQLYKPFTLNGHPILFMDIVSAEMTKYAANAMLATKISFINDIANLCEIVGANVNQVRKGIGSDTRIGNKFIYPGTGYGGSCFPKDVKALIRTASECGYEMKVLKAVEEVNDAQKSVLFHKINNYFQGQVEGKKIAIWGLSFKPQTDDMREAPSLTIINKLLEAGAEITAYDPAAMNEARLKFGAQISLASNQYDAIRNADCLVIPTEWPEFRVPDFEEIKKLMKKPVIFDGRNIFDVEDMKNHGIIHFCIGIRTNDNY
jgi:UDPglucose 6-dehydrogenase